MASVGLFEWFETKARKAEPSARHRSTFANAEVQAADRQRVGGRGEAQVDVQRARESRGNAGAAMPPIPLPSAANRTRRGAASTRPSTSAMRVHQAASHSIA